MYGSFLGTGRNLDSEISSIEEQDQDSELPHTSPSSLYRDADASIVSRSKQELEIQTNQSFSHSRPSFALKLSYYGMFTIALSTILFFAISNTDSGKWVEKVGSTTSL